MDKSNIEKPLSGQPSVITEVNTEIIAREPSDTIDVRAVVYNYLRHWYWFLISLVVCGALGWIYMHKKSPVYDIRSVIMLNQNDDESSSLSSISALASQFGFGGGSSGSQSNIYDEMIRLESTKMMGQVVAACRLNESAWENIGFFKPKHFYYGDSPYAIQIPQEVLDTLGAVTEFHIEYDGKGKTHLSVRQNKDKVADTEISRFPYTLRTPACTFVICPTRDFVKDKPVDFHATVLGTNLTIYNLQQILQVGSVDKKANAIQLIISTANVPRGEAILNAMTSIYNQERYDQKLQRRKEALAFVNERLLSLYSELEQSENKIEAYKRENKIVDAQAEAEYIFARKGAIQGAATQTRTELEIFTMLRDMLNGSDTRYSLLPFATSAGAEGESKGLAVAVEGYNDLILKRMELLSGTKGQSSQLERINGQLDALRANILTTLNREIQAKKIALSAVEGENSISENRISEIPSMEKKLTQLYRDREVKNAIYAFLLQKREEAEMAVQQVEPICEVVDPPYAGAEPSSPKKILVYGVAFFFGLLLPLVFVRILCKGRSRRKESDSDVSSL